ncbi:MAG: ATP-binding cassette domain-containing protein, partial [Olsenella sp.]
VTEGSVSLDGVDVRRMSLSDLRSRVGYVPQQGRLFSGTVASNVVFADVDVTDEDIERALRVSQSEEFVSQMPDGADSPITQGGTNVSGGQRQRLAIARALAAHPEVLVLDDSFSALDYATDAALRRSLAEEENDVTVVVVAQRVASVMHADRIIVLDEGSVVGDGTHEELLRSCPTYREIATSQLSEKELGLEAEVIPFVPRAPEGGDE